jgi:hypothetical protein
MTRSKLWHREGNRALDVRGVGPILTQGKETVVAKKLGHADLQAAEAGDIDWGPTQSIPEDYFAYGTSL